MRRLIITVCMIITAHALCRAQVQITLYPPSSGTLSIQSGWNASLNNLTGEQLQVYLSSEYQNSQGEIVLDIHSQVFVVMIGEHKVAAQQLAVANAKYSQLEIKQ